MTDTALYDYFLDHEARTGTEAADALIYGHEDRSAPLDESGRLKRPAVNPLAYARAMLLEALMDCRFEGRPYSPLPHPPTPPSIQQMWRQAVASARNNTQEMRAA